MPGRRAGTAGSEELPPLLTRQVAAGDAAGDALQCRPVDRATRPRWPARTAAAGRWARTTCQGSSQACVGTGRRCACASGRPRVSRPRRPATRRTAARLARTRSADARPGDLHPRARCRPLRASSSITCPSACRRPASGRRATPRTRWRPGARAGIAARLTARPTRSPSTRPSQHPEAISARPSALKARPPGPKRDRAGVERLAGARGRGPPRALRRRLGLPLNGDQRPIRRDRRRHDRLDEPQPAHDRARRTSQIVTVPAVPPVASRRPPGKNASAASFGGRRAPGRMCVTSCCADRPAPPSRRRSRRRHGATRVDHHAGHPVHSGRRGQGQRASDAPRAVGIPRGDLRPRS